MVGDQLLGFGPEGEVCEEDITAFAEKKAGEREIDS